MWTALKEKVCYFDFITETLRRRREVHLDGHKMIFIDQ